MESIKNRLFAAAIIAGLAVIGSLMNSQHVSAQAPPNGLAVDVIKSIPLQVTGSTTVSGNVGITGTPNVNVNSLPAVRLLDEPGRSPFLSAQTQNGGACTGDNCIIDINLNGPGPNTRLVITDVSVRAFLIVGGRVLFARLFSCSSSPGSCTSNPSLFATTEINIPVSLEAPSAKVKLGSTAVTTDVWTAHQQVNFYIESGNIPVVELYMDPNETSPFLSATISGHTISLP